MEQYQIDQGIRLKKLIKALDLNQSSFAKSIGKTQPNINRMISGSSNISGEVLNRISDRYNQVNLHWLLTGVGEMFLDDERDKNTQVKEVPVVKGRLEELEERMESLEETVKELVAEIRAKP